MVLAAVVVLGACSSVAGRSTSVVGTSAPEVPAAAAPAAPLPAPCVDFLEELQCWLRAAGNDEADVSRAVGNLRASFEVRSEAAESCERAVVYRAERMASAGCANPSGEALPAAARIACAHGEHFFVRADGHVSGCHRDCALPEDCPEGSTCGALGSAAGGPIDERYCEPRP